MSNIFNDFELLDFINFDEMMWEQESGGITLTVSSCQSDIVSNTPVLTQSHILVAANDAHVMNSDQPALIQNYFIFAVNSTQHWTSSWNAKVALHLDPASADHDTTSTNVDLIDSMPIANGDHVVSSDSPVLAQVHTLIVQNATHSVSSSLVQMVNVYDGAPIILLSVPTVPTIAVPVLSKIEEKPVGAVMPTLVVPPVPTIAVPVLSKIEEEPVGAVMPTLVVPPVPTLSVSVLSSSHHNLANIGNCYHVFDSDEVGEFDQALPFSQCLIGGEWREISAMDILIAGAWRQAKINSVLTSNNWETVYQQIEGGW